MIFHQQSLADYGGSRKSQKAEKENFGYNHAVMNYSEYAIIRNCGLIKIERKRNNAFI